MDHETNIDHFPAYGEWRPKCQCGWTGSYVPNWEWAQKEADRHVEENE